MIAVAYLLLTAESIYVAIAGRFETRGLDGDLCSAADVLAAGEKTHLT
jgi:hypothetical protein